MNTQSGWIRGSLLVGLLVGLLAVPDALAGGRRGGGGGRRAPRMSAPQRAYRAPSNRAPQMARSYAPARANANVARANSNNAQARVNGVQPVAKNAKPGANSSTAHVAGTSGAKPTAGTAALMASTSPNTLRYGTGSTARPYRATGYGRGYRNRGSSGSYGRSQGNNRSVVSRLRSVHKSLARLQHDYQGHRVQAMHHVSMAIRQLSHRSMVSGNNGLSGARNNILATGTTRRTAANGNVGANGQRTAPHMTQAQSDSRMSQALRTTQGIAMQMRAQGTNSTSHTRAHGHLQRAMHELNTALAIR